MKKYLYIIISVILLQCGCSESKDSPTAYTNDRTTLVWYMPCTDSYIEDDDVTAAVNNIIHRTYPNIDIDFKFVNIYEYAEKLSVYLSAKETADIVWTSDETIPYINYPNDNIYKFLDVPLKSYAPNIGRQLYDYDPSLYKIYDRIYSIPTATQSKGLVPFIKIPTELCDKLDIGKLADIVNNSDNANEDMFEVITEYIDSAYDSTVYKGIDMESIYQIFPLIGYESFISTSDLIGYRISDPAHTAVDMLSMQSSVLSFNTYNQWMQMGYIRDDIAIAYKTGFSSEKKYILSGVWGYVYDDGVSMLCDKDSDGYTYIAVDNKYHTSRLFSASAMLIPVSSKHSEEALKILELFYQTPELYTLITYGIEHVHWEKTDDGLIKPISNSYHGLSGIVPIGECPDQTIPKDNIIMPQLLTYETAGMYIPAASSQFRRLLFDYTDMFSQQPYLIGAPSNSDSNIQILLDIYNGYIAVD